MPNGPSTTNRELFFDFTSDVPTAHASFMSTKTMRAMLPESGAAGEITDQALRRARLLDPGQRYNVGISLVMPETPANRATGMFQVFAELMTARGDVLANATRPATLRYASAEVRWLRLLVRWPLFALGFAEEKQTVALTMFADLSEERDKPFTAIRVSIKPHAHGPKTVPAMYAAHATVNLRMSILTRAMYRYPASSFVLMLVVTWGYMCMMALALFALVVVSGAIQSPSSFASDVVTKVKRVMKVGGAGEGDVAGQRLEPFFDGLTTSSDDEGSSNPGSSRDSSNDFGRGGISHNDEGLRRRKM